MKKKTKSKTKLIIRDPLEIYFTKAEEKSLKESLKNLNIDQILRDFAIVNIVEIFEKANNRKDINWR